MVETSPVLREAQARAIPDAIWHDSIADLPARPLLLVANEFFDALPIHQYERTADGWRRAPDGGPFPGKLPKVPVVVNKAVVTRE